MHPRPASPFTARLATPLARTAAAALAAVLAVALLTQARSPEDGRTAPTGGPAQQVDLVAAKPNPVTPGDFTGYGFDQCLAPTQKAMDVWLNHSPFLSVGIYISGNSRACRSQPNLTPTWIRKQLTKGWRLLPITLGPQASCSDRFPRYKDDPTINPKPGKQGLYGKARRQARQEAAKAVAEAKRLGITKGSTLWYDLEAFDTGNKHCRESALSFLSAWTKGIRGLGYKSGVYSSAGSGIQVLDDARVNRPKAFDLPDMIWVARWDGVANTSTSYIREDGWRPGARVKQYQGGHDEKWGGVTINIDRNYLDVGRGSVADAENHCNGTNINPRKYGALVPGTTAKVQVRALQCLLQERGRYNGKLSGVYNPKTIAAVRKWQSDRGFRVSDKFSVHDWIALHMDNANRVLKVGSAGGEVRRLQRALRAAKLWNGRISGVYDGATASAVRTYQGRVGLKQTGIVNGRTNVKLDNGRR